MAEFSKKEGRKIKSIPPMSKISPYIMPNRSGASVYMSDTLNVNKLETYINKKKAEGLTNFNIMHVLIAGYVRTVAKLPAINRFLRGQKVYARNDIEVVITIKKEMKLESPDTCVKMVFSPDATAEDVYNAFEKEIQGYRAEPDNGVDNAAKILNYIPGVFLKFTVWLLKLLDYFGWLPRALTKISPFHGSLFITSMGSLGIPVVFHHLYDFGNLPIFLAFGTKYKKLEPKADGSIVENHYVDYNLVVDERICDGYYYGAALKYIKHILRSPDQLDTPPAEVREDIK